MTLVQEHEILYRKVGMGRSITLATSCSSPILTMRSCHIQVYIDHDIVRHQCRV